MSKKKTHCLDAHLLWGFLWLFNCHLNYPLVSPRGFWRKWGEEPGPCAVRSCSSRPTSAPRLGAGGNRAVRGLPAVCPQHLPALSTGQMRGWLSPALLGIFLPSKEALRPAQPPWCRSPHAILHLWSRAAAAWALNTPLTSNFLPGSHQQHEMWSAKLRKSIPGRVSAWSSGTA